MQSIYASVDLGGTNIKCAFGRKDGDILLRESVPTASHEGPEAVLARIAGLIDSISRKTECRPDSVGMGVPGLIDLHSGTTKFLPNLPTQWRDVPVRRILTEKLGCPVHMLNDVRMATLGELTYGHGKTAGTLVFLALGTGIGGGIAVDGKLRLGPVGAAGEIGHQTIHPDGPPCGCGSRGCLETYASGPAIQAEGVRLLSSGCAPKLHEITGGDISRVTPKTMQDAAEAGDPAICKAISRAARYLGIGISNMILALHPDVVVLGGGVARFGELLFAPVRETVRDRVRLLPVDTVRIEPSTMGEQAGTLGGIALAAMGGIEQA